MKIFNKFLIPKTYKRSSLAIGNFDGIHKGHQRVFKNASEFAKQNKSKFGILTFSPLPVMFFNKKIKNYKLTSDNEKLRLLKKFHVDFVFNVKFNRKFSKMSANNFISNIIYKKINPARIFVSNNFKFGYKRKGNLNLLKKFEKKYNFKLIKISPYKYKKKIVSSTKIRKLLNKGNIDLTNKLLGRTWMVDGHVVRGRKLGRKLGYRTCNVRIKNYILPKAGIYAVKLSIESKRKLYFGAAYFGSRPTFKGKEIFLEIYIFGINKNLYKKKLRVYFLKFIRADKKFKNSSELVRQMNKDVILVKKRLKEKKSV